MAFSDHHRTAACKTKMQSRSLQCLRRTSESSPLIGLASSTLSSSDESPGPRSALTGPLSVIKADASLQRWSVLGFGCALGLSAIQSCRVAAEFRRSKFDALPAAPSCPFDRHCSLAVRATGMSVLAAALLIWLGILQCWGWCPAALVVLPSAAGTPGSLTGLFKSAFFNCASAASDDVL